MKSGYCINKSDVLSIVEAPTSASIHIIEFIIAYMIKNGIPRYETIISPYFDNKFLYFKIMISFSLWVDIYIPCQDLLLS